MNGERKQGPHARAAATDPAEQANLCGTAAPARVNLRMLRPQR